MRPIFLVLLCCMVSIAHATSPLTLDILAKHPDSYLRDKVQIKGVLAGNVLYKPFLYASMQDAIAHKDHDALDAISDDPDIRKALHVSKPMCVIVTGVFNEIGKDKDGHIGAFGFEGFAYINIQRMQRCNNS